MKEERKQDLSGPDEEALEQHVREMLDVTVPDKSTDEPAKNTKIAVSVAEPQLEELAKEVKKATKPSVAIKVSHDDAKESASPVKKKNPELDAVIAEANEQLAKATGQELAASAPLPPSAKKRVKIVPLHEDELKNAAEEQPAPQPDTAAQTAPTVPDADIVTEPIEETIENAEEQAVEESTVAVADKDVTEVESQPVPEASAAEPEIESPLEQSVESKETDKAVTDIIAAEGDELLAAQDAKGGFAERKDAQVTKKPAKRSRGGLRGLLSAWLHSSRARWVTFLVAVFGLIGVGAFPTSRYFVLNTAGVRSSASAIIFDQSTQQPLKNVKVTIAGQTRQTDGSGKVQLDKLRLGPTELVIQKRAFAEVKRSLTVGWGSNPLGEFKLTPTGDQYGFIVVDFLSDKPIPSAEAVLGESNAVGNDKGELKLTLDVDDDGPVKVLIKAPGYREEEVTLDLNSKQDSMVRLVPDQKVAFVSKRSGKYDIYKIDADGKNEQVVLAGTGNEQEAIALAQHPTGNLAAFVSTRDGKRDEDGFLLSTLTLVNLKDNSIKTVTQSQQIHLVDWAGTRLVYVQIAAGASASNPQRHRLMSYDYVSGDNRQLAASNYFNDIVSAHGKIYYAPSSAFQKGVNNGMFSVQADGSNKQTVFNQEVWNMYRTSYDTIVLAVQQDWYEYKIGQSNTVKLSGQPGNIAGRVYATSPDGKKSLWVDSRDGKGTALLYDTGSKQEKTITAQNGLRGPLRWISNSTFVYRVNTQQETADYIMSIDGGAPRKISDVTNTAGIDRWYYY